MQLDTGDRKGTYDLPFNDLIYRSHSVHRANFDPNEVQLSKLLNIKTGGCPEDCSYCSQSSQASGLAASKLMKLEEVMSEARQAKKTVLLDIAWELLGAARRRGMRRQSFPWSMA